MKRNVILGLLAFGSLLPLTHAQENREHAGIVEEQDQLARQLARLRSTMEVLLKRLQAEGRPRTSELLRDAIKMLDERASAPEGEAGRPVTPEERMAAVRDALRDGQFVKALEDQKSLVVELEHLLSVLLDRKNLEALEEKIAELRALQEAIDELASEEADLREKTQELREDSSNEAQRELETRLAEMVTKERELLNETESHGRKSGTLGLEQLERAIEQLLRDQKTDAGLLSSWVPAEQETLKAAAGSLAQAQRAEEQAARLDEANRTLQEATAEVRAALDPNSGEVNSDRLEAARERLENARQEAELAHEASRDEAALTAAEALGRAAAALDALEAARSRGEWGQAAEESLQAESEALEEAAQSRREAAQEARTNTSEGLEQLREKDTAAAAGAEAVEAWLERANAAAKDGDTEGAKRATERALGEMEAQEVDLDLLAEALSSSQAEQARAAGRARRQLQTLPQGETAAGQEAGTDLEQAAEAMAHSSEAARLGQAQRASESAAEAVEALERALAGLGSSRTQSTEQQAQAAAALAQAQDALRKETGELEELVPNGSMDDASEAEVSAGLERAREAMERASEELGQGRSASAAGSQREALQELAAAMRSAGEGVTPQSGAQSKRAQELAAEQERIREEILDLAKRIEERENSRPLPDMQRASKAAESAESKLSEGQLAEADQKEREVEQELKQVRDQLQEEEDQYQRLREEEQLFRIAEEVQGLLDGHLTQMEELREIDSQRRPDAAPSRAQKLRLRRVAREEESLGTRALEMTEAIRAEGATVSAQLLENVSDDLMRIAEALGEQGDYDTGDRTQALQRDVEEALQWLLDALREEQARRKEQNQQQQEQQEQDQDQGQNRLVPDTTELKLLRRMEIDIQESVRLLLKLSPELAEDPDDVDDRVLRDISRLALRHEGITQLFREMRERLGLPAPETP